MCGIAGVVEESRDAAERAAAAMLPHLRHRGPDDAGTEVAAAGDRALALCATRLAVRDVSPRGHQPMVGPTGSIVAFNGELYNAGELRERLAADGRAFRGGSDTEVVLAAFEAHGDRAWPMLRGMFGLAAWDPRAGALSLVRDPLGIKPLYYAATPRGPAFASEIRALLAAGVSARLCPPALMTFLATGAVEEPLTIVEGVRMLPPGAFARWRGGELEIETYWSLDAAFERTEAMPREEAVGRVREALLAAVRRQLVSDVPLGVFLSGGLDSSSLVGLASAAGATPRTASVVFAEPGYSEAPYIRAVQERFATDHHAVELSAGDFLGSLPAALAAMDQPTMDAVNTFVVSRLARESAGLTVALSGLGGDELFAGYELFRTIPRLERMRARLPRLPGPLARAAGRAYGTGDRGRKLAAWLAGRPGSAYEMHRELFGSDDRDGLLPGVADPGGRGVPTQDVNEISRLEIGHYMRNVLLRDADVMSMANSLEVRVPMIDQEVVELVARIPGRHKVQEGREKPLLADALEDLIPPAVRNRDKMGFTLPFENWLRGPLRDDVRGALLDPGVGGAVGAALDARAVEAVWERFERSETSWSRPWALYVAKLWGERHL